MNEHKNKNEQFKTTSFYLAAFLLAKDIELKNIDCTTGNRCYFIFQNSPQRIRASEVFNFAKEDDPEGMIDARKLINSIKSLKDKLYQSKLT